VHAAPGYRRQLARSVYAANAVVLLIGDDEVAVREDCDVSRIEEPAADGTGWFAASVRLRSLSASSCRGDEALRADTANAVVVAICDQHIAGSVNCKVNALFKRTWITLVLNIRQCD
jgi:hypothetical protein